MSMTHKHLSDDRLVEIGLTDTPSSSEQQHLGACAACEARRASVSHMLEELTVASHEDADAAFPADRLARQQLHILQRIDQEARSAKVLAFPAAQESSPGVIARTHSASRWIAAAAVAGLLVGAIAGRLGHDTTQALGGRTTINRPAAAAAGVRTVSATISDEELLGQIEMAVDGRTGRSLRPLDELTPRAWEVR
jgi:hypothetical protein